MNNEKKMEYVVQGYRFADESEANIARSEVKKIDYIDENMNYSNLKMVYNFYNNCIENNIFQTPIGYAYLEKTRNLIVTKKYENTKVQAIPVATNNHLAKREVKNDKKIIKKLEDEKTTIYGRMRISIIINIVLIILVIGMFIVARTSDNPNIINYEKALVDRYASWEEKLSEREEIIREKELELSIMIDE